MIQPLYGFKSAEPYRFRRTVSNTQDLFYVEDEEIDFDTILNRPLPKVPLDVTFTAHWLAIEGVQPAIPQNPTPSGQFATLGLGGHGLNLICRCQERFVDQAHQDANREWA